MKGGHTNTIGGQSDNLLKRSSSHFCDWRDSSNFALINAAINDTVRNDELSNSFRNDYYSHRAQIGFKQVTANYTYDIGVAAVPSSSQSIDLINSDRNIPKRTVFNVAPYLRYRYKMGKQRSLRIDYRGYSSQPSMNQLQPVEDRSDPLRIVVGNPELKPAFQNWE